MPLQLREFFGRGESLAFFWHVYGRNGEMFLGLGIIEGGGNNQPIEGRTKMMLLVHKIIFDEVCKYMYYVCFLFLPFLPFCSFDSISSSNLNPTLEIDPMMKCLSKSRAARWLFKTFFMLSILMRVMIFFVSFFVSMFLFVSSNSNDFYVSM